MSSLYRYTHVPDADAAPNKLQDLLEKNHLYLSSHKGFNDPYDCKSFMTTVGCDDDDAFRYIDGILKILQKCEPDDYLLQITEGAFGRPCGTEECQHLLTCLRGEGRDAMMETMGIRSEHFKQVMSSLRRYVDDEISHVGIVCLTEHPDNILMWSHYADKHRGVCVEFDKDVLREIEEASLVEVDYIPHYPSLKELVTGDYRDNWPGFFLSRKANVWGYEDEWRLISRAETESVIYEEPISLPADAIRGIIFGACTEGGRDRVSEWLEQRVANQLPPVTVHEAKLMPDEYALRIH